MSNELNEYVPMITLNIENPATVQCATQGKKITIGAIVWRCCPCGASAPRHGIDTNVETSIPEVCPCAETNCDKYHGAVEDQGVVAEGVL